MTSEVTEADFFDHEFKTCKVAPVTGSIGAEISDIDITKPLSQEQGMSVVEAERVQHNRQEREIMMIYAHLSVSSFLLCHTIAGKEGRVNLATMAYAYTLMI